MYVCLCVCVCVFVCVCGCVGSSACVFLCKFVCESVCVCVHILQPTLFFNTLNLSRLRDEVSVWHQGLRGTCSQRRQTHHHDPKKPKKGLSNLRIPLQPASIPALPSLPRCSTETSLPARWFNHTTRTRDRGRRRCRAARPTAGQDDRVARLFWGWRRDDGGWLN